MNQIKTNDVKLTFGYVRELKRNTQMKRIIPQDIQRMINAYHQLQDCWNANLVSKRNKNTHFEGNKAELRPDHCYGISAFSNHVVEVGETYIWHLRIEDMRTDELLRTPLGHVGIIGTVLDDEIKDPESMYTEYPWIGRKYAFAMRQGVPVLLGAGHLSGARVEGYSWFEKRIFDNTGHIWIKLDNNKERTLSYKSEENKAFNIAFSNLPQVPYRLALKTKPNYNTRIYLK